MKGRWGKEAEEGKKEEEEAVEEEKIIFSLSLSANEGGGGNLC